MRVFFAINPNEKIQHTAKAIVEKKPFSNMRWSKPENMHLTVRFLGSVDENQLTPLIEQVQTSLNQIKPFTIETDSTICFPKDRPKVFAIYFKLNLELAQLIRAINDATTAMDFLKEKRAFLPHLTLGRFNSKPIEQHNNHLNDGMSLDVNEIILYRSEPTPEGSQYSVLHRFNLA